MTRIAGVDFGSNTVGYLIADAVDDQLHWRQRNSRFVRLAEGVRQSSRLSPGAIERTTRWVIEIAQHFAEANVENVRVVGTAALRIATDEDRIHELVRREFGVALEILTGRQEAHYTHQGVRVGYPAGELAVLDIGGGSTELSLSTNPSAPVQAVSWPMGAVVLTEEHGERWDDLVAASRDAIAQAPLPASGFGELTVIGGTGANVAMMDQGSPVMDDAAIEGYTISDSTLTQLRQRAQALTPQRRITELGVPAKRADVMIAGLAILETVLNTTGIPMVRASRYSLRHGIVAALASEIAHR